MATGRPDPEHTSTGPSTRTLRGDLATGMARTLASPPLSLITVLTRENSRPSYLLSSIRGPPRARSRGAGARWSLAGPTSARLLLERPAIREPRPTPEDRRVLATNRGSAVCQPGTAPTRRPLTRAGPQPQCSPRDRSGPPTRRTTQSPGRPQRMVLDAPRQSWRAGLCVDRPGISRLVGRVVAMGGGGALTSPRTHCTGDQPKPHKARDQECVSWSMAGLTP